MPPDVGVLIPAGGSGERAGGNGPKQFRSIAGIPMLQRTLQPFLELDAVHTIVVALPSPYVDTPPAFLRNLDDRVRLVAGGSTRARSARNALVTLPTECAIVLVHDAARPFVTSGEIEAVVAEARRGHGAIVALPVTDTLKLGVDGAIRGTIDRSLYWRALTPQGFPRQLLEQAYAAVALEPDAPDDAWLVEAIDGTVRLVPGSPRNIKVTLPDDFVLAEALARQ